MEKNLTQGNTYKQLIKLSLPIMGTSLIQMSYNLMDMFWVGKLSSEAVSAAGIAGYVLWIGFAIAALCKTGAEVGCAQSIGRRNKEEAQHFINNAIAFVLFISLSYSLFVFFGRYQVMNFFHTESSLIEKMALNYLSVVLPAVPVNSIVVVLTSIYHGFGNSRITFKINTLGLILNMILDPLLIFVLKMGVTGAALATALSQLSIFLLFLGVSRKKEYFQNFSLFHGIRRAYLKTIAYWVLPAAGQSLIFASFSAVIARLVTSYGNHAFAAQQIGVQIESIGWLSFLGLSSSIGVFVAQNYGAGNESRVREGIQKGFTLALVLGLGIGLLLFFGADVLFRLFIRQEDTVYLGVLYLKIMALAQVFSALEAAATGSLNGMGKTVYPGITGILGNFTRIPLGYLLAHYFGVPGIWWAIAASCFFKGILPQPVVRFFTKKKAMFPQHGLRKIYTGENNE